MFFIRYVLANYCLSVCAFSFHSFNSIFHRADIFTFLKCILWIFSFMGHIFIAITKVSLSNRCYLEFFIRFLLEILQFWILHLSMIHCKLIFVKGTRPMTRLKFFYIYLFQYHLSNKSSFLHFTVFVPLLKISSCYLRQIISECSSLFYWSPCLFFHWYHTVLMAVAL